MCRCRNEGDAITTMEPCAQGHAARRTGPQAQNPKVTLPLTLQLHVTVMPRGAPIPKPTMSYRVTGAMGLKRQITPVLENLSYAASDGQPAFLSRFYEGIWQMGVWQQISLEKHTVTTRNCIHVPDFALLRSSARAPSEPRTVLVGRSMRPCGWGALGPSSPCRSHSLIRPWATQVTRGGHVSVPVVAVMPWPSSFTI